MEELPNSKKTRLGRFDYSSNAAYFLTICVKDKKRLFGEIVGYDACDVPYLRRSRYGKIADDYIMFMNEKYYNVFIDNYIVMPNHLHMIVFVSSVKHDEYSENIKVGFYGTSRASSPTKMFSKTELTASDTRQHEIIPKFVSLYKRYVNREIGHNIWQRGYYDHIIRDENDYKNIYTYIDNNPAHWAEDKYYINN